MQGREGDFFSFVFLRCMLSGSIYKYRNDIITLVVLKKLFSLFILLKILKITPKKKMQFSYLSIKWHACISDFFSETKIINSLKRKRCKTLEKYVNIETKKLTYSNDSDFNCSLTNYVIFIKFSVLSKK